MVEMLGVLAIASVLTVGGIAGYSKAMKKYKTNKTIDQITQTIANVQTLFAQQSSYDEYRGTLDNLLIPQEARNLLYISGDCDYSDGRYFNCILSIGYSDWKRQVDGYNACIALASMDWKGELGDSFVGITLSTFAYELPYISGATDMKSAKGKYDYWDDVYYIGANHLPLSLSEIVEYCKTKSVNNFPGFSIFIRK